MVETVVGYLKNKLIFFAIFLERYAYRLLRQFFNLGLKKNKGRDPLSFDEFSKQIVFSGECSSLLGDLDQHHLMRVGYWTQVTETKQVDLSHGAVLMHAVKKLSRADVSKAHCVEFGTGRGFSLGAIGYACEKFSISFHITTVDLVDTSRRQYWRSHTDSIGPLSVIDLIERFSPGLLNNVTFCSMSSSDFCSKIDIQQIHLAFFDGAHDPEVIKTEFRYVIERLDPKGICVFDDVNMSKFRPYALAVMGLLRETGMPYRILDGLRGRRLVIAGNIND